MGGRRERKALGQNKALAQKQLEEIERQLLFGVSAMNAEKRDMPIRELAKEYLNATECRRRVCAEKTSPNTQERGKIAN